MKKLISIFCILTFGVMSANAWIFLKDAEVRAEGLTLLKLVSKKGNLRICMDYDSDYFWRSEGYVKKYKEVEDLVEKGYNEWLAVFRAQIEKEGRGEEFQDVLKLLPKRVAFTFVNEPEVLEGITFKRPEREANPGCTARYAYDHKIDLIIHINAAPEFYNGECATTHNGTYRDSIKFFPDVSSRGNYNRSMDDLVHEIGHTLGLSDMYKKALDEKRPYSATFYTMLPIEPAQNRIPSAMSAVSNCTVDFHSDRDRYTHISCDDIDGIINVLDHYYPEETFGRSTTGWLSLCPNKKVAYAYSVPFVVSEEEMQAQQAFVEYGREEEPPLVDKIQEAENKSSQFEKALQAQQRALAERKQAQQQERLRKEAQADSLINLQAQRELDKMNKSLYGQVCPICYHEIGVDEEPVYKAFTNSKTKRKGQIAVHQHCAASVTGLKGIEEKYIRRF